MNNEQLMEKNRFRGTQEKNEVVPSGENTRRMAKLSREARTVAEMPGNIQNATGAENATTAPKCPESAASYGGKAPLVKGRVGWRK